MSVPAAGDPPHVLHLEIAGRPLRVEAHGTAARDAVTPALGHLVTGRPTAGASPFHVWCDDVEPHPLWEPAAAGPARLGEHGLALSRPQPPALEAFTPEGGLELWGTTTGLAAGDTVAHPAGTATAAWLATSGAQVLHVGAVAFDGRAVLVVGAGGAGKSTAVVASGLAGATVLGDDMCVVDRDGAGGGARVHALYATLKLNDDSAARLGMQDQPVLGVTPKGKRVLAIGDPLRVQATAPVCAIVALRPTDHRDPADRGDLNDDAHAPRRLEPRDTVRVLTPTGLNAALGAVALPDWFSLALRLARTVPAFEVARGWDLPRVVDDLAQVAQCA